MKDEKDILWLAKNFAYSHTFNNANNDTYNFTKDNIIDFARKVSERDAPCLNFCEAQAFKIEIRQLKAALEKQEPKATTNTEIDAALDAILVASGSSLKHYTMPSTKEMMRHAMLQIIKKAYMDGSNAFHRAMQAE